MIENFWIKWVIFVGVIVGSYFALRQFADIDALEEFKDTYSNINEIELDWVAAVLTLLGCMMFWVIMWKTPYWATTPLEAGRYLEITTLHMKILISLVLPLIGYPLVLNRLNRND